MPDQEVTVTGSQPRVCVPVVEPLVQRLAEAIRHAAERADLVEVRLDHLPPADLEAGARVALDAGLNIPLIMTLRPVEQGGRSPLDLEARFAFWRSLASNPHLYDWELDLMEWAARSGHAIDGNRIICSYHDFQGIPRNVDDLFRRMIATPARIIKLAVAVTEATECLTLIQYLRQARSLGREMIAVAMGEAGAISRVMGSVYGSYLSYASAEADLASAPGQITVDELLDLYRYQALTSDTAVMGIVGSPVSQSLSPYLHNAAFAAAGFDAVYLGLPVGDCAAFLRRMVHPSTREFEINWRGLSVTTPHKRSVLAQLDRIDPVAEEIGAVNTIVVDGDQLRGFNTDAEGFIAPLQKHAINLRGLRCAVIGAGGAGRAAVWALQRSGALTTIFARHPDRARLLGREFAADFQTLAGASFEGFDLVVQTTPLGTRGEMEGLSPVDADQLRGVGLVYDLVYNPAMTQFLRDGIEAGCKTLGGLEMLVAQASAQFRLWTGNDAPIEIMQAAAERQLGELSH